MKKLHDNILKWLMVFGVILMGITLQASTLDWDAEGWAAGTLSNSYADLDGSGVNIVVNITGDTDNIVSEYGYPTADTDALLHGVDFNNTTQEITTTIKFSTPVLLSSLRLRDIDSSSWDDKVIITAKDISGNTVNPNIVELGSKVVDLGTGNSYESDGSGTNLSETNSTGFITFDFNTVYVTEMSIVYTSGSSAPTDPGGQALWLNNIIFEALDADGDGIADVKDIDDDNDGIVDAVENPNSNQSVVNSDSEIIPDNGAPDNCIDKTFLITEIGTVDNVMIDVNITHTYRGRSRYFLNCSKWYCGRFNK